MVPMPDSGKDPVATNVSISWQENNTVTVTASYNEPSEWKCEVQLECAETESV